MKFIDEATIYVKAGGGGKGCVSFRREKFVPRGGPDGGDGGKGGDIVIAGNRNLASLLDLKYKRIYRAKNGKNGSGKNKKGADGEDVFIYLPLGTIVHDERYTAPLSDITEDGETYIIARGGKGGRGNSHFATSTHRAPLECENGEEGEERHLRLVLKLLADVGIVGLPNVGKSTLISRLTDATPRTGNYPFTTLTPALGVCREGDNSFVIADIPGLVEGASQGKGLGITFLKHVERTRAILCVLDVSSESVEADYAVLMHELYAYKETLFDKRRILVLNKIDLVSKDVLTRWEDLFAQRKEHVVKVSALREWGIEELKKSVESIA